MLTLRRAFLMTLLCLTAAPPWASTTRWMTLAECVKQADRIVLGRCTHVIAERDPDLGVDVVRVRIEVDRLVKGTGSRSIEFRQLAHDLAGTPSFKPGEELLVLLYPESSAGLTTAVGLAQGKFAIERDKQGRRFAINGFGNRRLQGETDLGGSLTLERLLELIEFAMKHQQEARR